MPLLLRCRIEKVDRGCQGVYICRVSSPSGHAEGKARLIVQGKWSWAGRRAGESRLQSRPSWLELPSLPEVLLRFSPSAGPLLC